MLTSYVFDPSLNLNKFFQNTPPLTIQINDLPQLPKNWLAELENKCHQVRPNLEKNIFLNHVGQNANYKLKTSLLEQLSLIYYRIYGNLDKRIDPLDSESSQLVLLELTEDIQQCTPGFHIRVIKLVNSLQIPQNIDHLLYLARKSIIQEIAASLTHTVQAIYQVHVVDRVSRIAKKQGLGIEPNIQKDQYKSSLSGSTIRKRLKNEFPTHYTAFKMPFLLTEQLQLILNQQGYKGPDETGYAIGPTENMLDIIQCFLINPSKPAANKLDPFFILDETDEFGDPTRIYDINWNLIRQLFFQRLINEKYFSEEPHAVNLTEYAYLQALAPEKANLETETRFINHYLNKKNYAGLIDGLMLIQDKFPDYWQKLIKNPLLVRNIENFFSFLKTQALNVADAKALLKKINLSYTLCFAQPMDFILNKIILGSQANLTAISINFNLLSKSIRYRPEVIQNFFNILFARNSRPYLLFFDLLFKQNSEGANLLMLAGQYHAETVKFILDLISKNIEHIEKEKISLLLLTENTDKWNLLSLAAMHCPAGIKFILDFIHQHPLIFDRTISFLFHQRNNQGWDFLQLLVRYQSETYLSVCLDFIHEKSSSYTDNYWLEIVLKKNYTGGLLCLAVLSNPTTLNSILNFIDKHINQLDDKILPQFFLEANTDGWHCLHIAARYNFSSLQLILDFIQKHIDRFDASSLSHLFLSKNNTRLSHFLMLAAYHQPKAIDPIFRFINQFIDFFDPSILQDLFLQQNSDGWNFLSAAFNHAQNLKIILGFINDHIDKFTLETIQQIILQENNRSYTCLHLTARFQPNSLEVILDFISQHIELFSNKLTLLFEISNKKEKNLLDQSVNYQPESTLIFLKFLITHAHRFNLDHLKFKNFIYQTFLQLNCEHPTELVCLKTLLDIYLNHYRSSEKNSRPAWYFFSYASYTIEKKKIAAETFRDFLGNSQNLSASALKLLLDQHPCLAHGRLGEIYRLATIIAVADKLTDNNSCLTK